MKSIGTLLLVALLFLACHNRISTPESILSDIEMRNETIALLFELCDWAIEADLASGELSIESRLKTSIFINSNLARMLCAAYDLSGNPLYLETALEWFDRLVDLQQLTHSSDNDIVGYWGDLSPEGNIYLGDAGTAAHALARAVRYTQGRQKERYLEALRRYGEFVRNGTREDPQGKNRGGSPGWIIMDGPENGAIGCGYYRGELSLYPYTISTSVTGAGFFSALFALDGDPDDMETAENAVRWLLSSRTDAGEIPYILHNNLSKDWPLDSMSYFADGVIGAYLRTDDEDFRRIISDNIKSSIYWSRRKQRHNGVWGKMRSEDQQRSQGVLNLLVWYYHNIERDQRVLKAIHKNINFFRETDRAERYGIKTLPISTGFTGLALAETIEPGITYAIHAMLAP
ncbi:hypothetical protein JW992_04700 [candidate division KSB1 bacterium]|nr:hypothetical protein [candidate division KSB1 bacterium]